MDWVIWISKYVARKEYISFATVYLEINKILYIIVY